MMQENSTITFTEINFNPFAAANEIEKTILINESQREIWLSCMIGGDPANLAYNESVSLDLKGNFSLPHFKKALEKVVERHEALRSAISGNGDHFIIYDHVNFEIRTEDLTSYHEEKQVQLLQDLVQREMVTPFHLESAPLFRFFIHQLNQNHYYFTLVVHHIIVDGWSIGIILEDLSKFYNGFLNGISPALAPPAQISDYAISQFNFSKSQEFKQTEKFWLDIYKDQVPVLDLPTDFKRPAQRTYNANRLDQVLPQDLVHQLKLTGAKSGCSFVNTLLSAFEIFLSYKTGQENVVVGLPTAGQSATEMFDLVCHSVNLLPLKSSVDPGLSFQNYLKNRKTAFFDAYEHQQFSFGQLIKKLSIKRDHSRIPLVPVMFNIDMGMDSAVSFHGLEHRLISNPRAYETFEIFLNATESQGTFILEWTYNTQLFKVSTIKLMMEEFEALLFSLSKNPDRELSASFPGRTEQPQPFPPVLPVLVPHQNLIQLIEKSVALYPDKKAVHFQHHSETYQSLSEKSDQLASFLIEKGVQTGDVIGLAADRSAEMLISLIGILKAGAVYVPLDPEYPGERVEFMLDDSSAKILLISRAHQDRYESKAKEFVLEEIWPQLQQYHKAPVIENIGPDNLAYILYTSGSTGKPKGVKITHGNLVNFLTSMLHLPGINENDRLLAITTISFDIAGLELYLPLISGAEIFIADHEQAKDGRLLLNLMKEQEITIMQATPSSWQMIIDSGWDKKLNIKVLCGGEALPKELAQELLKRSAQLWNMYGPTETTIWSTIKQITAGGQTPSIGTPINHTQIYIMDESARPLPPGVEGEIYIGGLGVAEGYLNRPELTAEKFVPDPYSGIPGAKLYRTGDLGKLLDHGEFTCMGRIDQQIKIRGHRIELGEIESVISALEGIKQTVVVARETNPTDKHLIAYVLLNDQPEKEDGLSWKERWDTLYNIGAESKKGLAIDEQNLDDTLLEHYQNKSDLAVQLSEWLNSSTERVKAIGATRIYEIGSGAGQLLFELAPGTEYYVATDYANTAIVKLNEKIKAQPEKWGHVKAATAAADDFSFVAGTDFNLVLIHSVAQYFENADYLINVLKKAAASIHEGGCIFIGDMQGKNSLEMCHATDHLPHSSDNATVEEFRDIVLNRVRIEDEFVADPGFFYNLPKLIPAITGVDIQLRQGQLLNETTKYHYDIWLYIGKPPEQKAPEISLDWSAGITLQEVKKSLAEYPASVVEVRNILNSRTAKDLRLMQLVQALDPGTPVSEVKMQLQKAPEGTNPELFWKLGRELHFNAHVKWSADGTDGLFEVVFIPESLKNVIPENPYANSLIQADVKNYAKTPFSKNEVLISKETIEEWKETLRSTLPLYMVPEDFIGLKSFPLTPNAKIDRNALPKRNSKKSSKSTVGPLPATKNERLIAKIWSTILELEDIKIKDDFFELGGHSILAVKVMVAIEKETGRRLPLAALFENPTIEKLAKMITIDEKEINWDALVKIKPEGSKMPIYMIHGSGLNVLTFNCLGRYMDKSQPVYGIQGLGLDGKSGFLYTMEEIAAKYVEEMINNNPSGPYAVAGYSSGGLIAYEMAKQLKAMGKEIAFLGILDTDAVGKDLENKGLVKLTKQLIRQTKKMFFVVSLFFKKPKNAFDYQLKYISHKFNQLFTKEYHVDKEFFTYEEEINRSYSIAYDNYVITPLDIEIHLFRAEERIYYLDDPTYLGWDKYALRGVKIHEVPGDHQTFLLPPYDKDFSRILQNVLDSNK